MANLFKTGGSFTELNGNASTDNVLSGKTFYSTDSDNILTGTMPNRNAESIKLSPGGRYTIPWGYHGGGGSVECSKNFSKTQLEYMGFTNVPSGEWWLMSTMGSQATSSPGFNSNIIPLVISEISASYSQQMTLGGAKGHQGQTDINGKVAVFGSFHVGGLAQYNNINVTGQAKAYNVFVPAFFNMNLTSVQNNVKSGTIVVWLQRANY